jgi:putative spermidine/putrescine transport system ATP-binding protein
MTVAENVSFPLEMRGWNRARRDEAVRTALDQVQLGQFAHRSPARLSGGQQQRVALARALVYQPSIVLMDEPLGALDKKLREHMQFEIRRLHRELGITVVYVTHDQDEAMSLSDRICLMNNARIEQIDAPRALYDRPRSIFAANFLGESNLIPVTVEGRRDGVTLCRAADGTVLRAAAGPISEGAATLVLRPERCRLLPADTPAENAAPGVVEDAVMVGALTRVILSSGIGRLIVVALSGPNSNFIEGERVTLSWSVDAGNCIQAATA